MSADEKLASLEQLAKLKANGVITDAEFAREKAAVLAGRSAKPAVVPTVVSPPAVPPTAASAPPPSPRRKIPFGRYALIGLVIGLALEVPRYLPIGSATPAFDGTIPACDSAAAKETLTNAIEHGPNEKTETVRVLDIGHVSQIGYDAPKAIRTCNAMVTLNTGEKVLLFAMRFNSDRSNFLLTYETLL